MLSPPWPSQVSFGLDIIIVMPAAPRNRRPCQVMLRSCNSRKLPIHRRRWAVSDEGRNVWITKHRCDLAGHTFGDTTGSHQTVLLEYSLDLLS